MSQDQEPPCECSAPGFCPRYQIRQQEYPWKVCQGIVGTAERSQSYRQKWSRNRQRQLLSDGPSTAQLAANAAQAAGRIVGRVLRGLPVLATPETVAARLAICQANTCGFHDARGDRCLHKKCGCGLRRRLVLGLAERPGKLEIASEQCPMGLWCAV